MVCVDVSVCRRLLPALMQLGWCYAILFAVQAYQLVCHRVVGIGSFRLADWLIRIGSLTFAVNVP